MKKYTIISFIFMGIIGLLTYINTDASTTFNMLGINITLYNACLLYTSPSPRDRTRSRMPSSA
jgi:predicted MFS family arabinose efflux permease